jgi:hypothetical protein
MSPREAHTAKYQQGGATTDASSDASTGVAIISPRVASPHSVASPISRNATRSLPDLATLREIDAGSLELRSFYLRMLPLLNGITMGLLRRGTMRFEPCQLHISCDLKRLEIKSPENPSSAAGNAQGSRRRMATSFVRVEVLVRVHVPRTTLMALQEAIGSHRSCADSASDGTAGAGVNGGNSCKLLTISEQEIVSARATSNRAAFLFDLMLMGAEPWRLEVADAHTFHIVTTAIGALITQRSSLPAFAAALGLGLEV